MIAMVVTAGKFFGLGEKASKIVGVLLAILLAVFLAYRLIDSYGDVREEDGVNKERSAWLEAEREYEQRAEQARTEADQDAAKREHQHAEEVRQEREEINEAIADGRSPLDVMFDVVGVR